METFMICGDGWSGWLHVWDVANIRPFQIEIRSINGGQNCFAIANFKTVGEVEQYMDELDEKYHEGGVWA